MRVADFHCDLLSYLAEDENHTAHDPISRASIPLLQAGGVRLQTLAVYTKTETGSVESGSKQTEVFFRLSEKYPVLGRDIKTVLSIENASGFCDEEEPLEKGIERLESWLKKAGKIAYISLTWNGENRFGGGNATQIGLKPEGRELLRWMARQKIPIDLSHTSDKLAEDILAEEGVPVASHSNFRAVAHHPRNLPDPIAKEIATRGGVIGLNFVRVFLGKEGPEDFIRQLEHAEKLGILDHLCFGADFFADQVLPPELQYLMPMFNPGFDNASCYPKVRELLLKHISPAVVDKIAYENLTRFLA